MNTKDDILKKLIAIDKKSLELSRERDNLLYDLRQLKEKEQ